MLAWSSGWSSPIEWVSSVAPPGPRQLYLPHGSTGATNHPAILGCPATSRRPGKNLATPSHLIASADTALAIHSYQPVHHCHTNHSLPDGMSQPAQLSPAPWQPRTTCRPSRAHYVCSQLGKAADSKWHSTTLRRAVSCIKAWAAVHCRIVITVATVRLAAAVDLGVLTVPPLRKVPDFRRFGHSLDAQTT